MVEVPAFARKAATTLMPLLRSGLASLAKGLVIGQVLTFLAMLVAAYVGSRQGGIWPRVVSALFVGVIGTIATVALSSHRAVFAVIEAALEQLTMGSTLFQILFQRLLGISDEAVPGERLGALGRALETRIPLAQAEERLHGAIERLGGESHGVSGLRGWLLTKVRRSLLELVASVTLTRFRRDDQTQGAIDLRVVRDELGVGLDALLIDQVHGLSARTTWLFGCLAVALAALSTYVVYAYG